MRSMIGLASGLRSWVVRAGGGIRPAEVLFPYEFGVVDRGEKKTATTPARGPGGFCDEGLIGLRVIVEGG